MSAPVLAVLEQPQAAGAVLIAAARLAALLGAVPVRALAVRVPAEAGFLPSEEVLTDRRKAAWEAGETARIDALRAAFGTAGAVAPDAWSELAGDPAELVAAQGKAAAMLVLARPAARGMRAALHAALFDTGRPVLLVPPECRAPFGRRIAIGWQDDPRAERALLAAIPLLRQAAHVCVLGAAMPHALLAAHGIRATSRPVVAAAHQETGGALLDAARDDGADLLVMGAFAHNRWRELILGGVTQHVLAAATIPVLMRH